MCLGLASGGACAQAGPGLRITSGVQFGLSYLDNSRFGATGAKGDLVAQITPNVQIVGRSGRITGSLSYALDVIHHARKIVGDNTRTDSLQNSLNAALNAELVPRWAYVDVNASIAQRSISAYGQQSATATQLNSNRTEVSSLSVSPYLRGPIGSIATYQLSVNGSVTNAKDVNAADAKSGSVSLAINSATSGSIFGWGVQASRQRSKYNGVRATDNERVALSATARPLPDVSFALHAGQESSNVGTAYSQSYANWGGDARWTPSPRTSAALSYDKRYFGNSYQLSLDHRFALASVRLTSSRDAIGAGNANGGSQPVTLYQIFFAQFASLQPDPSLRDQLVRDYLRALGLDPGALISGGYVNTGVTLLRRTDLSTSYAGRRVTLTLQAFASQSSVLDGPAGATDNNGVQQTGFNAIASYRLTPTSNLNLSLSELKTSANAAQLGNSLKSVSLSWNDQLGKRSSAGLSARYSVFDSPLNPYHESALSGTLSVRF